MRIRWFGLMTCLAGLVGSSQAKAECRNTESARVAYERGERALQRQEIELAVRSFIEANQQCPNPETQLAIANAYLLGRQAKLATDALNRYIADAANAADWCSVLESRRQIAHLGGISEQKLTVRSLPQTAQLYIRESSVSLSAASAPGCLVQASGGQPLEFTLPPGNYTMTGLLAGKAPSVNVIEFSKSATIDIVFAEPSEVNAGTKKPLNPVLTTSIALSRGAFSVTREQSPRWYARAENWVWIGSGAVAVAGAATGIWALSLQSDLNRDCPNQKCPEGSSWALVDKHDRLATLSTVGFVLAGAGAAVGAGIYLVWRRPSNHLEAPQVGASIGLGQLSLKGRF